MNDLGYVRLSQAQRETIELMLVIGEFKKRIFKAYPNEPIIHSKSSEDNPVL